MQKGIFFALLCVGFAGCGSNDSKSSADSLVGLSDADIANIGGTYASSCAKIAPDSALYAAIAIVFSNGKYTYEAAMFSDSKCTYRLMDAKSAGSFAFSDSGRRLALTTGSDYLVKLYTDEMAAGLNQQKFCDVTDWRKDVERNLLETSCKDEMAVENYYVNKTGAQTFELIDCEGKALSADCSRMTMVLR